LTRIIIGTVCASDLPINAAEVTAKLNAWGIAVTKSQVATRLGMLAKEGRIDSPRRGLYEGY
jgi:hypothetical protein